MAEYQGQMMEVIAKEITIALIEKSNRVNEQLTDYACQAYDKVLKQVVASYREVNK